MEIGARLFFKVQQFGLLTAFCQQAVGPGKGNIGHFGPVAGRFSGGLAVKDQQRVAVQVIGFPGREPPAVFAHLQPGELIVAVSYFLQLFRIVLRC